MIYLLVMTIFCCGSITPLSEDTIIKEEIIFTGKVTEVCRKRNGSVYHFDIIKGYKGVNGKTRMDIFSHHLSASIFPRVGEDWLIVSNRKVGSRWHTDACSNSARLSDPRSQANLAFLDDFYKKH